MARQPGPVLQIDLDRAEQRKTLAQARVDRIQQKLSTAEMELDQATNALRRLRWLEGQING